MAKKKQVPDSNVEFNMTPMIDVTFQLIIFFIIAGQIVSNELEKLKPPQPHPSIANSAFNADKNLIINIVSDAKHDHDEGPDASRAKFWAIKGQRIEVHDMDALKEQFEKALDRVPDEDRANFTVELRSDRRVQYADVETVLLAAAESGNPKMNITAIVPKPGDLSP